MKKLLSVFLMLSMISLVGCNDDTKQEANQNIEEVEEVKSNENKETTKKSNKDEDIYGLGEESILKDEDGKDMYSLKINNVKVADEFIKENNENYEINGTTGIFKSEYEQVVEVNYTYTNIAKNDDAKLYIEPQDLQVADIKGEVGEATIIPLKKEPQQIIPGTSSTVEGHYALVNKSDNVKIIFYSELYDKATIFEVPVIE